MMLEKLVADCVLQNPVLVKIGEEEMYVSKPTIGTLIECSKLIGEIPDMGMHTDDNALEFAIGTARNYEILGLILATFILGRKGRRKAVRTQKKRILGIIPWVYKETYNEYLELADRILDELSPKEMSNIFAALLGVHELAFFLQITTTLREANLLRRTKED